MAMPQPQPSPGPDEEPSYIDYETFLDPNFSPSAFANTLVLATNNAADTTLDLSTPLNFVTTNDIIGGNSGSPVIDKQGRVIGAAFDGNIHSLGGNYGYDGTINRTVAVSAAAVQEALEKIYPAPNLVAELKGK